MGLGKTANRPPPVAAAAIITATSDDGCPADKTSPKTPQKRTLSISSGMVSFFRKHCDISLALRSNRVNCMDAEAYQTQHSPHLDKLAKPLAEPRRSTGGNK
jgi:hypothetical protein